MARPAAIKRGTEVELVKWMGINFQLVSGKYRSRDATHWVLELNGVEFRYLRSEWDLCIR